MVLLTPLTLTAGSSLGWAAVGATLPPSPTLKCLKCCFHFSHKYYDSNLSARKRWSNLLAPVHLALKAAALSGCMTQCQSTNRSEKPAPPQCAQTDSLLHVCCVQASASVNTENHLLSCSKLLWKALSLFIKVTYSVHLCFFRREITSLLAICSII